MRRFTLMLLSLCFMLAAGSLMAQEGQIGLGVSVGAAFPNGSSQNIAADNWDGSFNWGFYVNIPLLYTFHISPSAELYKLGGENATDMSLAFKFIVPLDQIGLYVGFVPGLTTVGDVTAPHVGIAGGVTFNLVSNVDLFTGAQYKILFDGSENVRVFHANAGLLFNL